MVVVLPELAVLLLMLLALAIAFAIQYYLKAHRDALRVWFGWLPGVGHLIDVAVSAVANVFLGWMQKAIDGIEAMIGAIWHAAAALIRDTYDLLVQASTFAAHIAKMVGGTITHAILNDVLRPIRRAITRVDNFAHDAIRGLRHRMQALEQAIPRHLRSWIRATTKAIETTLPRAINGARDLANRALGRVTALEKYIAQHIPAVGTDAFTAAVAVALAALGLSWTRCNSNPFRNNRNACGLWDDLAGLLGLAATVAVVADFEELVHEAQDLEAAVIGGLRELWNL